MRKGKSAAAIVVGRGGKNAVIARRNPALESGNITSSKRAARLPLKWRSPVCPLKKYRYPHLPEVQKLKEFVLSENGLKKYMETTYCMFSLPGNVIDLTGHVLYTLFGEGLQMEGDVMDFLINQWKDKPETSEIFSCADRYCLEYDFFSASIPKFDAKKSAGMFRMFVREEEDLLNAKLVFMPFFKPINKLAHYSVYVLNRYCGSIDILDSLPYSNKRLSRTSFHGDCANIFKRFVGLLEEVHGKAEYKASKQPNWPTIAKRPTFVKVPKRGNNECGFFCVKFCSIYDGDELVEDFGDVEAAVDDWKAEYMHTLVFSVKNEIVRGELPAEIQSLGP